MIRVTIALLSLVCLQFIFGQVDSASLDLKDASNDTLGEEETATWFPLRISSGINHFCSDYSKWCWKWCRNSAGGFTNYYCYISPYRDRRWIRCGNDGDCMAVWPCVTDCFKDK